MKIVFEILRYFLAVLLGICLLGLLITNIVSTTILEKAFVYDILNKSDYYNKIYDEVYTDFALFTFQSGFDDDILKDIVSKEKITADTNIVIENYYGDVQNTIEVDSIKENLQRNIDEYLSENNLQAESSSIEGFKTLIAETYNTTISHYANIESKMNTALKTVSQNLGSIKTKLLILSIIVLIIQVLINNKKIGKLISMLGCSGLFFALSCILIKIIINVMLNYEILIFLNQPLTDALSMATNKITGKLLCFGIIFVIISLCLIFGGNYLALKGKNSEQTKPVEGTK